MLVPRSCWVASDSVGTAGRCSNVDEEIHEAASMVGDSEVDGPYGHAFK